MKASPPPQALERKPLLTGPPGSCGVSRMQPSEHNVDVRLFFPIYSFHSLFCIRFRRNVFLRPSALSTRLNPVKAPVQTLKTGGRAQPHRGVPLPAQAATYQPRELCFSPCLLPSVGARVSPWTRTGAKPRGKDAVSGQISRGKPRVERAGWSVRSSRAGP